MIIIVVNYDTRFFFFFNDFFSKQENYCKLLNITANNKIFTPHVTTSIHKNG